MNSRRLMTDIGAPSHGELNMAGKGFGGRETSYSSRDPIFAWASWGVIPEMTKARVRDLKWSGLLMALS